MQAADVVHTHLNVWATVSPCIADRCRRALLVERLRLCATVIHLTPDP